MARRKKALKLPEGSVEHLAQRSYSRSNSSRSSVYTNYNNTPSSLPTSPTLQIRFKRILSNSRKSKAASHLRLRRKDPPIIIQSSDNFTSCTQNNIPTSETHSKPPFTAPSTTNPPVLRPLSANSTNHYHHHFHHHHYSRSNSTASSSSSFSNCPPAFRMQQMLPPQPTEVAAAAAVATATTTTGRSRSRRSNHRSHPSTGSTDRYLPDSSNQYRPASLNHSSTRRSHSQTNKGRSSSSASHHIPVNAMASLENLSQLDFTSPSIRLKRNGTVTGGRSSSSPIRNFFFRLFRRRSNLRITNLRKNLALRLPGSDGKFRQYRVKSIQMFRTRRKPKMPPPVRGQISQPLSVTHRTGIDNTGRGDLLSIRSRRSLARRSTRDKGDSTASTHYTGYTEAFNNLEYDYRTHRNSSENSLLDQRIDQRLDRIQLELDEARKMKRQLSSSSRGSSRNPSSSFMSLTPSAVIERRPDINRRISTSRKVSHPNDPVKVEEALAFVNTWSAYLRRAIAVRIVLRQEIQKLEELEQTEWQQLHAVQEEDDRSSYTGETETVSSFGTESTISKQYPRAPVRRSPVRKPVSRNSYYSTADEGVLTGDVYYPANGDAVSVSPISPKPNTPSLYESIERKTHKRTASSIRRALTHDRMSEKYSSLMVPVALKEKELPALPVEELSDASSFSKPGKESAWIRGTSSTGSSVKAPRPLPEAPVVQEVKEGSPASSKKKYPGIPKGLPRLLQQQRNMSDKILADMVQEMEELQVRSRTLSGMAKSHRDDEVSLGSDGASFESKSDEYQTPSVSDASLSSDLSIALQPLNKASSASLQQRKANHYVLDSESPRHMTSNPNLPSSSSSVSSTRSQQYSDLRNISAKSAVPRKISTATTESLAAAASVNLSRGKMNKRRTHKPHSRSRSGSSEDDADSIMKDIGERWVAVTDS